MRKLLYWVGLLLGLGLFLRQAWLGYSSLPDLWATGVRPVFLFMALGCAICAYLLQMSAWAVIMRYLSAPLLPSQVWQGYLLAFLPRYIPGTVWGYLSRNEWLAQRCGISYATSSLASLLEVTTLLLTAFLYGLYLGVGSKFAGLILPAVLIALWANWHYLPRLAQWLNAQRWTVVINPEQPFFLWVMGNSLYLLFWAVHGLGVFLLGQALTPLPLTALLPTLAAASLAWAAGFLILVVPAGLGVREATLVTLLTQFTALPSSIANTIALLSRLTIVLAELVLLLGGVIGQLRDKWANKNKRVAGSAG